MKKLFIIPLLFILVLFVNAQDSLTFAQFKCDFMNIEIEQIRIESYDASMYETALGLATAFVITQIIVPDNLNKRMLRGSVFVISGGLTLYIIHKKSKLRKSNEIKL